MLQRCWRKPPTSVHSKAPVSPKPKLWNHRTCNLIAIHHHVHPPLHLSSCSSTCVKSLWFCSKSFFFFSCQSNLLAVFILKRQVFQPRTSPFLNPLFRPMLFWHIFKPYTFLVLHNRPLLKPCAAWGIAKTWWAFRKCPSHPFRRWEVNVVILALQKFGSRIVLDVQGGVPRRQSWNSIYDGTLRQIRWNIWMRRFCWLQFKLYLWRKQMRRRPLEVF